MDRASALTRLAVALGCVGMVAFALSASGRSGAHEAAAAVAREDVPQAERDALHALELQMGKLQRGIASVRAVDRGDLRALQEQLEEVEQRVEELAESKSTAALPATAPSEDVLRERERERTQAYVQLMEHNFVAEVREAAWAARTEALITGAIQGPLTAAPTSVRCQSTLCRVEMRHADDESAVRDIQQMVTVPGLGDVEAFSERTEHADGKISTLTFVAGQGTRLPSAPRL